MLDRQAPVALALAVVALIAAVALVALPEDDEPGAAEGDAAVWDVETDDVVKIEIVRRDDTVVLAKGDGGWRVEAPLQGLADTWRVDDLLREAVRAERGTRVAGPEDADSFGLGDPPDVELRLVDEGGGVQDLRVGREAPTGWRTYVQARSGDVVAVEARLDRLSEPATAFLDKAMLRFDLPEVVSATLRSDDGELTVSLDGGGRWWLSTGGRADPDKVDDLLVGLTGLRFEELSPADPGPLDDPWREAEVTLRHGAVHTLQVARNTVPAGRLVRSSSGAAGVASDKALALLGQGPPDLADRGAVDLPAVGVQAVAVDLDGRSYRLTRISDGWTVDGAEVHGALGWLNALEAVPVAFRRPPLPPLEPSGTIEVIGDDARAATFEVGPAVDGVRAMQDSRGGTPYLVDAAALDAALVPPT